MKNVRNVAVIGILLAVAGVGVSSAINVQERSSRASAPAEEIAPVAVVHVVGKRLTEEEKKAFEG